MAKRTQRKIYLVDREVQGGLISKAACYWLLSLAVVGSLNVLGWIFVAPGVDVLVQMRQHLPSLLGTLVVALISSLIVLPVLLYDLTKYTNRFAGPICRLQRGMNDVAEGKFVPPMVFREGDSWQDLADSFNRIVARLEVLEQRQNVDEFVEFETVAMTQSEKESATFN
jgi:nitrate/nitrite-specific signal transduction histidine kinase